MQTIFENLFFIENEQVTVFRFFKESKKFEYLKRDGLKQYPITDDFWTWWKETSDYVEDKDKLDFCFIYDHESIITKDTNINSVIQQDNSCWTLEVIDSFFEEMVDSTHIELYLPNGRKKKFDKPCQIMGGKFNTKKKLYTNIIFNMGSVELNSNANNISPFAIYFKELKHREQNV